MRNGARVAGGAALWLFGALCASACRSPAAEEDPGAPPPSAESRGEPPAPSASGAETTAPSPFGDRPDCSRFDSRSVDDPHPFSCAPEACRQKGRPTAKRSVQERPQAPDDAEPITPERFDALALVLAAADDVEGEGTRGTSAPARAWRTLRRSASREQALALLRHARAVPRARGAELVVARFPADTALLVPLLSDEAVVHVRTYDFGHATTVAAFVTDTLCRARYAAGDEVLLQTAREPGTAAVRARAAECLALRRRAEAWSALYGMLGSPDPKQLVVALGVIPAFDSPEGFERVSALASHLDANVRRATASALAGFCTLAAVRLLDTLLEDADASVRSRAFVVYVKHPLRDVEKVRHAFQGDRMETWAHDAAARIVGNQGLPESPGLIEAYLSRYPKSSDGVQQLAAYAPPMEASTRLFRKMLAESTDDHQRVSSIGYLGRAADRESLPLLEKSLKADWIIERDAAKEAILALGKTR